MKDGESNNVMKDVISTARMRKAEITLLLSRPPVLNSDTNENDFTRVREKEATTN